MATETLPFIEYTKEDFSIYPSASSTTNPVTKKGYVDADGDFLVGKSGGFLMKMDFIFIDMYKFTEAGDHYMKYGKYTLHVAETPKYNKFYYDEAQKRKKGATYKCKLYKKDIDEYARTGNKDLLHLLRITGDHYHYLNYGRLERVRSAEEEADRIKKGDKSKTIEGFPRNWDGDYWNFKVDEFCVNNDYNLCKGKARRKGYSFKRANQGANTLNLNPNTTILLAAYQELYLTDQDGTAWMLKRALDWIEEETYWSRRYAYESLNEITLGFKKKKGGNKIFGWNSKALSVSLINNTSSAAGKGATEVDFEEAGICPNLEEAIGITESTTESGAIKRGILRVYGTAGTKEANWIDFSNIFYKPDMHKMLPMENIWDKNSRHKVCGFFHPQVWNLEPYIDADGNSLLAEALEYDIADKLKAEQVKNPTDYKTYVGQRANSPAEAFKSGRDNIFTSPGLVEHKHSIEFDTDKKFWRDGMLMPDKDGHIVFKTNAQLKHDGLPWHPYIEEFPPNPKGDIHGCIREFHAPYRDAEGQIPKELYYLSYDTVDKDKDSKDFIIKNSINSIQVMMYPNNISNSPGDMLVASFAGRPKLMEQADRILLYLCMRYNAKALVEVNAGETIPNFKRWGKLQWLYRDPMSVIDRRNSEIANAPIGITIGSVAAKVEDGIRYLNDFLHTPVGISEDGIQKFNYHYINDLPLLIEILEFGGTGTFDRISSMIVAMYQRSSYRAKNKDKKQRKSGRKTVFEAINLYGMSNILK